MMRVKVITPVADEPVSLDEAKLYCRVDVDDDDTLLAAEISAAREFAEHHTNRSLAPQTLEVALDAFPSGAIDLPGSPVAAITSIIYTDSAGDNHTLDPDAYELIDYGTAATVEPVSTWPVAIAVWIRYDAGEATLPAACRAAILRMVSFLYDMRVDGGEPPEAIKRLLDTVRVY